MVSVIVPIKDHSERVPGKNFRDFNGKPLYLWIIERLAKEIPGVDDIIIDTDSTRLLNDSILKSFSKLKVLKRENKLLGDSTDVNLIINSRLKDLKNEIILQTHVTNPLLKSSTISKALKEFEEKQRNGFDSLMSVTPWQKRFYYRGKAVNHNKEELIKTQDLTPVLEENSNMYIFTKDSFKKNGKRRIASNPYLFIMDKLEATDIDYEEDFFIAQQIQKLLY